MKKSRFELMLSVVSLLVCISMLIGTTFAWFTDTASVNVNTIQAGNLDIELLDGNTEGASTLEGKTMAFLAADGNYALSILWEPGARYRLQPVYLHNGGNLHAKYQVVISGMSGDVSLAEVLNVYLNGNAIGTLSDVVTEQKVLGNGSIAPDEFVDLGIIEIEMSSDAGNEYQGKTLTDLSITVSATQAPVESDSFGSSYDESASLPDGMMTLRRNGKDIAKYKSFYDAVAAAESGDEIRLGADVDADSCVTVANELTIDGNGFSINKSGYAGTIFMVEEGGSLSLHNLTIDGNADNFVIDYSLSYPAVIEETLSNEPLSTASAVISYGDLEANNVIFKDHYCFTAKQAPLQILRGDALITDCKFIHNYSHSQGGAVYIGDSFRQGQTSQSIGTAEFIECSFENNYTRYGNGGAVCAINAEEVKFTSCTFRKNMAASYCAGGGAVILFRDGLNPTESNGLPYMQGIFTDCEFYENYSGNDGFAIDNECGELTIVGCRFEGNVGLSGNSAVGTVSEMHYSDATLNTLSKDCTFKGNSGAASIYGDHASLHKIKMDGCTFEENVGSIGILLYSSDAEISNCSFINENAGTAVIDIRSYNNVASEPLYKPMTVNINNVTISGHQAEGILVRKQSGDLSRNSSTVNILGNTSSNIKLMHGTYLNVIGQLTGNITIDALTPDTNITVAGVHNGSVTVTE